ncbi:MATE family efflux transporter [Nocardia bovistercoris]|uniref:Probable multidrug resistance protein NorM n=1 Tax=Nocardia bovistercoris TaxID=2785916 RepID=A0A931IG43_9NOCA|nr:MATE family efflux transporter [Nocardia bovistercoris]MBH0780809.1 hypothetical protein [Nocardia bovistercoris]
MPIILTSATTVVLGATDTALLGHYSTDALGIAALVVPVWILATALVVPWGSATQVLVARWYGAGDQAAIRRLAGTGLAGGALIGACFAMLGAVTTPGVVALTAPDGLDRGQATAMMWILLCALPFTAMTAHLRGLLAGTGDTGGAARVAVLVAVINLSMSAILIFAVKLGPIGSAIGSVTAIAAGAGMLYRRARAMLGRSGEGWGVDRRLARPWTAIAMPDLVFSVVSYGADVVVVGVAGSLGTVSLAAHRVVGIATALIWMFVYGTGAATAILVGQRIGAGDREGRIAFARAGAVLMLAMSCTVATALTVTADRSFALVTGDPAVVEAAVAVAWTLPLVTPIMAVATIYAAQLRAAADTKGVMYASLFSTLCVTLPAVWGFTFVGDHGLLGVYYGIVVGWVARAAATYLRYRQTAARESRSGATEGADVIYS